MKVLFLGDLHGNWPATEALDRCLKDIGADETWFLGDAVGKGPSNAETCDWVREHCDHYIGGNWDYGIGGKEYPADHYYWNQLGEERMRWLNGLPREAEITLGGIRFRLFHGRPVTPLMGAGTPSEELDKAFVSGGENYGGIIFADSHRPFIRTVSRGYVANTGSVGNSLGVPRAHALLVEESGNPGGMLRMSILCIPYDNEAAADIARRDPELPFKEAYIHEVMTGIYSR